MANIDNNNPPVLNDTDYVDKIKNSLDAIDAHDHTSGKGVQIPTAGIEDAAITEDKIANNAVTANKIAAGAVGSSELGISGSVVGTSDSQTLSNKTFSDAVTLAEIATPATPSSGFGKVYFKSDGFLYQLNDDGSETKVGAGSGGINYILNPDAESNTSGWATYADAAATTPVDGTGGSPTTTWTRSTSSPLRGTANFLLTKDAANRQGEGVSYDLTTASADQAKVLRVSFDYKTSSAYADGDVRVYIYRTTATARLIELSARDLAANTVNGTYIGEFQTDSDATGYRLILHVASTNASAYTIQVDNVQVGPREIARGPSFTKPELYTASLTNGTNATAVTRWWREASHMCITGRITWSAGGAAGVLAVGLPSGYSIDPDGIEDEQDQLIGSALIVDSGGTPVYNAAGPLWNTSTSFAFFRDNLGTRFAPSVLGSGDSLTFFVKVPILGWSASSTISSDFGGRVIAVSAYKTSTSRGSSGSWIAVTGFTVFRDETSSFDQSTGIFTVPESGWYKASGAIGFDAFTGGKGVRIVQAGSASRTYTGTVLSGSTAAVVNLPSVPMYCAKGDTLTVESYQDSGGTATYRTADSCVIGFEKVQSPQTMMGGEVVRARYTSSAAQSITNGATPIIVDFGTKDFDSHNAVTTGASWKFTAQQAGTYVAKCRVHYASATFTSANVLSAYIYKNNISYSREFYQLSTTGSQVPGIGIDDLVTMNAGDYIDFRLQHDEATARLLRNTGAEVYCYIEKVN